MNAIRVMIADDHGVMRDGLRMLINGQPDMEVVAEVEDATSVVDTAVSTGSEIVVLDLSMPGGGGIPVISDLRRVAPATRVVVLTMHEQPAYLRKALAAGASGYIAKRVAGTQLLNAIRSVRAGRSHIDASIAGGELAEVVGGGGGARTEGDVTPLSALSRRELEVLKFVAAGYTNQETANQLGLSVKTVEGYRARLTRKLDARGRADLVRYALAQGLLNEEPNPS